MNADLIKQNDSGLIPFIQVGTQANLLGHVHLLLGITNAARAGFCLADSIYMIISIFMGMWWGDSPDVMILYE